MLSRFAALLTASGAAGSIVRILFLVMALSLSLLFAQP